MWKLISIACTAGLLLEAQTPLTLAEAVSRSTASHPTVEAARARLKASAERISEARASFRPRVDFQESWVQSNNPVFVFGSLLTQRQFTAANFELNSLNRPDALNQFQSLITAEQLLWDGGRTRKSVEMAEIGRRLAATQVRQLELALSSRTARAYLDTQLAASAMRLSEQAREAALADLRQAEAVESVGRATRADALAVRVHLASIEQQLTERKAQARIAAAVLNDLIGAPPDASFSLTTTVLADVPPDSSLDRPELRRAELQLDHARRQTDLAQLAWRPQVGLRLGFEADRQRFVTRAGSNWMAGVSLKWNLYQGGADRARQRAAVAAADAAALDLKAARQQVDLEVLEANTLLHSTQARLATANAAITAAEESLRITRDRYEAGLDNMTSLLRAETALNEARFQLTLAGHSVRLARLNQSAALGQLGPQSEVLR